MLQSVAVCCIVKTASEADDEVQLLQYVAVCCSVLQCAAVCCSVLECAAVCCSVLMCICMRADFPDFSPLINHVWILFTKILKIQHHRHFI